MKKIFLLVFLAFISGCVHNVNVKKVYSNFDYDFEQIKKGSFLIICSENITVQHSKFEKTSPDYIRAKISDEFVTQLLLKYSKAEAARYRGELMSFMKNWRSPENKVLFQDFLKKQKRNFVLFIKEIKVGNQEKIQSNSITKKKFSEVATSYLTIELIDVKTMDCKLEYEVKVNCDYDMFKVDIAVALRDAINMAVRYLGRF